MQQKSVFRFFRNLGIRILLSAFLSGLAGLCGCSFLLLSDPDDFVIEFTPASRIVIVVEEKSIAALDDELKIYISDLQKDGISAAVVPWQTGTVQDLRNLLSSQFKNRDMDGAFLVGTFPAAFFEMIFENRPEEFPCDLYLMDPQASWNDADTDGIFDAHTPLSLKYFVSRLTGTPAEMEAYFSKVHAYRTGGLKLPAGAFLFKDDDWYNYKRGSGFGLNQIYDRVQICEIPSDTSKPNYISAAITEGSEFVYQWIHSSPSTLYVVQNAEYHTITTFDIGNYNFKGLFYNLYDCSAARFTQSNLGMAYLTKTDYALAVFGSTKVGGCFHPQDFYEVLSKNGTWGDAYLNWYNYYGKSNDEWFLGMVILGDPCLRVTSKGLSYRFMDWTTPAEPGTLEIEELKDISRQFNAWLEPQ